MQFLSKSLSRWSSLKSHDYDSTCLLSRVILIYSLTTFYKEGIRDFSLVNRRHFLLSILIRLQYQFPRPSIGWGSLSGSKGDIEFFKKFLGAVDDSHRLFWQFYIFISLTSSSQESYAFWFHSNNNIFRVRWVFVILFKNRNGFI